VLRANIDARRLEADIDAMRAVVTFRCGVGVGVDVKRVVRTGLHAAFAADAAALVEIHNAVVTFEQRGHRTNLDARRIVAMVAAHDREQPPGVGKFAFLNIFYPRPIDAEWHFMLRFAGDGAGVTADALAIVDDEAKIHCLAPAGCEQSRTCAGRVLKKD